MCSQASPRNRPLWPSCPRGSVHHCSPCPSTFLIYMVLLFLPAVGLLSPQSSGHFCSSSDLGSELPWVSGPGAAQATALSKCFLDRRQEQEASELCFHPVQATRICHLECCNWSPCFQFDTLHLSTFHQPPKGSFKTMEGIGSVLLLKRCHLSMPLGWSKNQTP